MSAPSVLISSFSAITSDSLVKDISKTPDLPTRTAFLEDIVAYDWSVDTKYYTANIQLCVTKERTIGNKQFADSVQAVILTFDSNKEESFQQVKLWLPFLKELEPPVCLLVCECSKHTDKISRHVVLQWCIENGFELIELSPEVESEDEDDDFKDSYGIERIIQALQAHPWQNLVMKDDPQNFRSPYMTEVMVEEAKRQQRRKQRSERKGKRKEGEKDECSSDSDSDNSWSCYQQFDENHLSDDDAPPADDADSSDSGSVSSNVSSRSTSPTPPTNTGDTASAWPNTTENTSNIPNKQSSKNLTKKQNAAQCMEDLLSSQDKALFAALGDEDPDGQSFEKLFENMKLMKEKAESLPPSERHAYAERMAISFWQAVGGDADEISGLVDSD